MTEREALLLALEALEYPGPSWPEARQPAITAIKEILAEPEQKPVAYLDEGLGAFYWAKDYKKDVGFRALYTTPPHRTWVGLTNDEIKEYLLQPVERDLLSFTRFIEAKLKEKNT